MNDLELLERALPAPGEATVAAAQARLLVRYRRQPPPPAPRRSRRAVLIAGIALTAAAALIAIALDAGSVLENVLELIGSTPVSPAATAAIFRYLATVPGLAVVEGARTHAGRSGIGISVAGNGLTGSERWVHRFLIFDPATSRLIGYRELAPGIAATATGHDRAWSDYLAQGTATLDVPPAPEGVRGEVGAAAERLCAGLARPAAASR